MMKHRPELQSHSLITPVFTTMPSALSRIGFGAHPPPPGGQGAPSSCLIHLYLGYPPSTSTRTNFDVSVVCRNVYCQHFTLLNVLGPHTSHALRLFYGPCLYNAYTLRNPRCQDFPPARITPDSNPN